MVLTVRECLGQRNKQQDKKKSRQTNGVYFREREFRKKTKQKERQPLIEREHLQYDAIYEASAENEKNRPIRGAEFSSNKDKAMDTEKKQH